MSNPPWMPLHIADYLRDTTHLDAEESGAYLHLIMGYWVAGRLPNDNRQLAAIAKVSPYKFLRIRKILSPFFGPGFSSHKRIDHELQRIAELRESLSERGREGAQKRWNRHGRSNGRGNAQAMAGDATLRKKERLTDREIEEGAVDKPVDKCGQLAHKRSAEEVRDEAIRAMRARRKGNG